MQRRQFISQMSLLSAAALVSSGCGSGTDNPVFSGGPAPGPGGPTTPSGGQIDVSQIGGTNLSLRAGGRSFSVGADGNVTVETSETLAQLLFVVDGAGALRGMALMIPGQPLAIDAASTALALAFLVPGIATTNPDAARTNAAMLRAAPSFGALVAQLRSGLPNQTLTALLPQLQSLIQAVIEEAAAQPAQSAKVFTGTQAVTARPGGLYIKPGKELDVATASFDIKNESFRYVSAVRQVWTTRNLPLEALRTNLIGAPLPGAVSVVGAGNGISIGNFLTGQVFTASSGRDDFSLVQNNPAIEHVVYYLRGLGNPFHADNAELPQGVDQNLFQDSADVVTLLMSVLFPLLDIGFGIGIAAKVGVDEIAEKFGQIALASGAAGVVSAANTGEAPNVLSALLDFTVSFLGNPAVGETLAALLGEGILVTGALAILEVLSLALTGAQFAVTAKDILTQPRLVAIEVPVPVGAFGDEIAAADAFNFFFDVNAVGSVLYQNNEGTLLLKKPFASAASLGGPRPFGTLSDEGGLTTFSNADGDVFLRSDAGIVGSVPRPAGMTPNTFNANPRIDPTGQYVAANALRSVGGGTQPDIFLYHRPTDLSVALNSSSVVAGGMSLHGISRDSVFARGPIGGSSTVLARYNMLGGIWTSRTSNVSPLSNYRPDFRGANKANEALYHEYKEQDDNFNPVISFEDIVIESPGGSTRSIYRATYGNGSGVKVDPLGINDEGEILAVITTTVAGPPRTTTERTVLFQTRGGEGVNEVDLETLLPDNIPAGNYRGLGIAGRYVVVRRILQNEELGTTYLCFLGRSDDDVKAALR